MKKFLFLAVLICTSFYAKSETSGDDNPVFHPGTKIYVIIYLTCKTVYKTLPADWLETPHFINNHVINLQLQECGGWTSETDPNNPNNPNSPIFGPSWEIYFIGHGGNSGLIVELFIDDSYKEDEIFDENEISYPEKPSYWGY